MHTGDHVPLSKTHKVPSSSSTGVPSSAMRRTPLLARATQCLSSSPQGQVTSTSHLGSNDHHDLNEIISKPVLMWHTDRPATILGRKWAQPLALVAHTATFLIAAVSTVWNSIAFKSIFLKVSARTQFFITEVKAVSNNSVTPLLFADALILAKALPLGARAGGLLVTWPCRNWRYWSHRRLRWRYMIIIIRRGETILDVATIATVYSRVTHMILWNTFARSTIKATAGELWPPLTSPLKLPSPRFIPVLKHSLYPRQVI